MKRKVTKAGANVCFFELSRNDKTGCFGLNHKSGIWKICIDTDLLEHACDEETNMREHYFAETLQIQGNKFILKHTDDAVFERLYRYALDGLTLIIRRLLTSIRFPAMVNTRNRTYAIVDSSELDENTMFAFCGLVEKYLVMKIVCDWYLRCNMAKIYELCKIDLDEAEAGIKSLLIQRTAVIPINDLNL
jgi:hypothetical protein